MIYAKNKSIEFKLPRTAQQALVYAIYEIKLHGSPLYNNVFCLTVDHFQKYIPPILVLLDLTAFQSASLILCRDIFPVLLLSLLYYLFQIKPNIQDSFEALLLHW